MVLTYEERKQRQHEQQRRYYQELKRDPERYAKVRELARARYHKHIDEERIRSHEKYLRTKAAVNAKTSQWFKEHREWDNERKRLRYAENRERELKRWARQKHKAYLSKEKLEEIWSRLQNGPCDICGAMRDSVLNYGKARMSIDHCHKQNIYRGILCHRCNLAIGLFKDDPAVAQKAAAYLGREVG